MSTKYQTVQVVLPNVRLAFADIYEAKDFNNQGNPKFSCNFLLDPVKDKKTIAKIEAGIDKLMTEELKVKKLPSEKKCLRDGDEKTYDGYAGMMFVAASNKNRPQVVNRKKQPVHEGDPEAPYSGCFVNAVINLWPQNNQFGKRVNASLEAVMFASDGDSFAGGSKVDLDVLPDMPEDDEEFDDEI